MKLFKEKYFRALFNAGIFVKAIDSVGEITLGLFLAFNPQAINNFVIGLFGDELMEQPRDGIWGFLLHGWNGFSVADQHLWAFIFLAHGITKVFLVIGLMNNKLWTYPVAAFAFASFALYQIYHIINSPSLVLELLTLLDIFFVFLIIHEYRYRKRIIAA